MLPVLSKISLPPHTSYLPSLLSFSPKTLYFFVAHFVCLLFVCLLSHSEDGFFGGKGVIFVSQSLVVPGNAGDAQ